jgi:20S proteasome alpha/beta subunit
MYPPFGYFTSCKVPLVSKKLLTVVPELLIPTSQSILILTFILTLTLIVVRSVDSTTLVAIKFDHGIVVGADSRTTSSAGSSYVSNIQNLYKVIPITHEVMIAQCGNAAQTQQIIQQVQHIQQIQFLKHNRILSVSQLAHYIRNIVYSGYNMQSTSNNNYNHVEIFVAGVNKQTSTTRKKQCQCQTYTITSSGAIIEEMLHGKNYVTFGSGSSYLTGYLEEQLCCYNNGVNNSNDNNTDTSIAKAINEKQAIEICRHAIEIAIQHDANSGGSICIYTIRVSESNESVTSTDDMNDDDEYNNNNNNNNNNNECILRECAISHPTIRNIMNNNNNNYDKYKTKNGWLTQTSRR